MHPKSLIESANPFLRAVHKVRIGTSARSFLPGIAVKDLGVRLVLELWAPGLAEHEVCTQQSAILSLHQVCYQIVTGLGPKSNRR